MSEAAHRPGYQGCWALGPDHYVCARDALLKVRAREDVLNLTMLTPDDVGRLLGDEVDRLRHTGKLLGLNLGGVDLYPGFQFSDTGDLLPVVGETNQALAMWRDAWSAADFWVRPHFRLNDQAPVEVLGTCWQADLPGLARL